MIGDISNGLFSWKFILSDLVCFCCFPLLFLCWFIKISSTWLGRVDSSFMTTISNADYLHEIMAVGHFHPLEAIFLLLLFLSFAVFAYYKQRTLILFVSCVMWAIIFMLHLYYLVEIKLTSGRTMVINVEYNQLDPLLRATGYADGDVNCETGYSPFPGNINQVKLGMQICHLLSLFIGYEIRLHYWQPLHSLSFLFIIL